MKKLRRLVFILACGLSFGCAKIGKTQGSGGEDKATICPGLIHIPYHQVNIGTYREIPGKLAVVLEGELKYDECLEQASLPPPPIVGLRRVNDSELILKVLHFGAYSILPKDISFEIMDRGDCLGSQKVFYSVKKLPLEFLTEYPDGPKCGSLTSARVSVQQ